MSYSKTNELLNLVSRSFALCIPMLPKKVQKNVGNFYLLCRYADTIEDSKLTAKQKTILFKKYISCIKKEDFFLMNELNQNLLPFVINKNDKKMVKVFDTVLKEFSDFDKKTKKISIKWLTTMVFGMQKYSRKEIENFSQLNNYCYFVAGTVGLYLTDMFVYKFELQEQHPELLKRAKDFGLFLQKVNIIRDFSRDRVEGRIFWPKNLFTKHSLSVSDTKDKKNNLKSKKMLKEMIANAHKHLKSSVEYLELLPKNEPGIRLFCAVPLCMAVPTLLKCQDNELIFDDNERIKMDRAETMLLMGKIKQHIGEDAFFREHCVLQENN